MLKSVVPSLLALFIAVSGAPLQKNLQVQLNSDYLRAMAAYRRLEPKMSRKDLRSITIIGILNGAAQVEKQMEKHLVAAVKDLLFNTDTTQLVKVRPKIANIERQLRRDKRAIEILISALDLATGAKNAKDFRNDMQRKLKESQQAETVKFPQSADGGDDMKQRVAALRRDIWQHVESMQHLVELKIQNTLQHLIEEAAEDEPLAKARKKGVHKRSAEMWRGEPVEMRLIKSILTEDDFRNNLIDDGFEKRQDNKEASQHDFDLDELTKIVKANHATTTTTATITTSTATEPSASITSTAGLSTTTTTAKSMNDLAKPVKQEEGSPEIVINSEEGGGGDGGGGGGGLVGIISSLSGGEGGSDVGALIGALTGLVSTLFGPGGLDVEALISTATSLISGLLAGDKNFGTVLGQYVGTAFDGFTGGGGAINNGQFFGNLVGTVVASLSADPEDYDEPPKPLIFAQNFLRSFVEAKNRKASDEESGERNGNKATPATAGENGGGGFDSSGFIKHVVSHVVGSAVSLILNVILGASGGASQASSTLLAGSSANHKPSTGIPVKWLRRNA